MLGSTFIIIGCERTRPVTDAVPGLGWKLRHRTPILRQPEHRIVPKAALAAWLGTYFVWHIPAVYDFALRNQHTVLHAEHATYFLAGLAVWWPVIHGAYSAGAKAAYLFAAFVLASPLGLVLALVPRPIYSFYVHAPRTWGPGPLVDQQIAGVTMAVEQAVVIFAVFASFMLRFLRDEQAEGALDELRAPFTQHS